MDCDLTSTAVTNSTTKDDWNQHWQQFGEASETGPTPKYRHRLILRLLDLPSNRTCVVLEIGSGRGEFSDYLLARKQCHYHGLEISEVGVAVARSRRYSYPPMFTCCDVLQGPVIGLSIPPATHAVCSEVVEHVDDPVLLLRNAGKMMAEGCKLVVTTPGGPMNSFYKHIGHRRHYTPDELAEVVAAAGFTVERKLGCGFPFFNLFRMLLTLRGDKLVGGISGKPSSLLRAASFVFGILFRLNINYFGWQSVVVAIKK